MKTARTSAASCYARALLVGRGDRRRARCRRRRTRRASLVACDDENDPKTWVKRLDDPAQRANAIKRLTQFYEDGMTQGEQQRRAHPRSRRCSTPSSTR